MVGEYQDGSNYQFNFKASWFKKFSELQFLEEEGSIVELVFRRDPFLESFSVQDDKLIEFFLKFADHTDQSDKLVVIKSRDFLQVEAHVPFNI